MDRYSNDANNISQGDSFTEINMILEAADLMTTPIGTETSLTDSRQDLGNDKTEESIKQLHKGMVKDL